MSCFDVCSKHTPLGIHRKGTYGYTLYALVYVYLIHMAFRTYYMPPIYWETQYNVTEDTLF